MIFSRSEKNTHYRELCLVSAGGCWQLGLCLYASGMRLRMGRFGRPPSVLDFCLGTDSALVLPVLTAVLRRLEPLDESAEPRAIDDVFPWAGTRPDLALHLDALLAPPQQPSATHCADELPLAHRDLAAHRHD